MRGLTRRRWIGLLLSVASACCLVALTVGGCGSEPSEPTPSTSATASASPVSLPFPDTPAGRQLEWVIGAMNAGAKLTDAEISAHFSPSFLEQVPAEQLRMALAQVALNGPLRYGSALDASGGRTLVARLDGSGSTSLKTTIVVEPSVKALITGLLFQPYAPVSKPASWQEIDKRLADLAAHASLLAVEVGGDAPIHARGAERAGAIGSAFKLYVLGALAEAVSDGSAAWTERLAIHKAWKSLPSGDMRNEPAGRRFTLRHYAEQMIAVSDNTATDHLMQRLGRQAVEAQLAPMGMAEVRPTLPFLMTREMFALKLSASDSLREEYIAAAPPQRRRLLVERVQRLPVELADAAGWTTPRDINSLEWFASPNDLVRAMEHLLDMARRPGLAPVRAILARNSGIPLDTSVWPYAAFKGGSEPGVLSLVWLLERNDGRTFALALVLNDTGHDVDSAEAVAVAEGAVDLLAAAP